MTPWSCLDIVAGVHRQWIASTDMTLGDAAIFVGVVGLLAAVAAAPLVTAAYSLGMRRYMAMVEVADAPPAWWQRRTRRPRAVARAVEAGALAEALQRREQRLRRATWCAYVCFVACGLPALWSQRDRSPGNLVTIATYLAVVALGPALVNVRAHAPGRAHWWAPLALTAIALSANPAMPRVELFGTVLLLSCIQLVSVHRVLRAVVGPLMVVSMGLVLAGWLALWLLLPLQQCAALAIRGGVDDLSSPLAWLSPAVVVALELLLALVVAAYAVAIALLRTLERLIDAGWLSDLSLVAASGLCAMAGLLLAAADAPRATGPLLTLYFAAWLGATGIAYALALRFQPCPQSGRTLLVLRVFSGDRHAERMLDALQTRWRLVGPVLEIGGPDLAKLNLDLREMLALVTFGLPGLLWPRDLPEARLAADLDLAIDREGRFRVNEVFCFDSSWQTMVERLMRLGDAIVLDLRGFDARRAGTTREVLRLAAIGALDRVVVVSDSRTDWTHYDATVALGGARTGPRPVRVDAADAAAARQAFDALLAIAAR